MIYLLHGAVGERSDWDELRSELRVHETDAVNLYSHVTRNFDSFATDLNSTAKRDDILIGYSMGGRLALHALVSESSPWSKAVIISSHTGLTNSSERELRISRDREWARLAEEDWDSFIEKWERQPVFDTTRSSLNRSDLLQFRQFVANTFIQWSLGKQRPLLDELQKIKIPVLWIVGELDKIFVKIGAEACDIIPNSKLELIPSAGHRVPWDNPHNTADIINSFIS